MIAALLPQLEHGSARTNCYHIAIGSITSPSPDSTSISELSTTIKSASRRLRYLSVLHSLVNSTALFRFRHAVPTVIGSARKGYGVSGSASKAPAPCLCTAASFSGGMFHTRSPRDLSISSYSCHTISPIGNHGAMDSPSSNKFTSRTKGVTN